MLPLVRVGAAVSADVVTFFVDGTNAVNLTKINYN